MFGAVVHVGKCARINRRVSLLLWLVLTSAVVAPAQLSPERELQFHSDIPLGIKGFLLKPDDCPLYLFATAQSALFAGMHQVQVAHHPVLLDARGRQVDYHPETLKFRVTASTWPAKLVGVPLYPVDRHVEMNEYLLRLRFRVLIFRGLQVRYVQPAEVIPIGMPPDIPYNERIYGLTFDIGHVPIQDRVVLEVLSPEGKRLCKFGLDLL